MESAEFEWILACVAQALAYPVARYLFEDAAARLVLVLGVTATCVFALLWRRERRLRRDLLQSGAESRARQLRD